MQPRSLSLPEFVLGTSCTARLRRQLCREGVQLKAPTPLPRRPRRFGRDRRDQPERGWGVEAGGVSWEPWYHPTPVRRLQLLPPSALPAREQRCAFKSARPRPPPRAGSEFQGGGAETAGGRAGAEASAAGPDRCGSGGACLRRPGPARPRRGDAPRGRRMSQVSAGTPSTPCLAHIYGDLAAAASVPRGCVTLGGPAPSLGQSPEASRGRQKPG